MNQFKELNSFESWISHTEDQREHVAETILQRLPDRFHLAESFQTRLSDGRPVSISCFYDEAHEMPFMLIPGGSFSYGINLKEEEAIRKLCTEEEWAMISPLLSEAMPSLEMQVPPFLMGKYPLFDWVAEELIELSDDVERPDFSGDDGPTPIYLTKSEIDDFLTQTGYRAPRDWEWEFVAKGGTNQRFISGNEIPSGKLLKEICITSFGNANRNKKASNVHGLSGMALSTLTTLDDAEGQVAVRSGAAGFYPFQGAGQWALLLTALRMPLKNMPGGVAGLRLCLDVPNEASSK